MALSTEQKTQIIKEHSRAVNDTGSVEVQVALLSSDISLLTEHFKKNKHDHHSRRGLMKKVNQRRTLLKYLQNKDVERYRALIKRLDLRG